ncbi:ribose ABC transporter substrate-binding protein [Microbacterium mangrovi]|uniref:Ribose ABC transporter substrate-binding protein n=1 Tax=Microbacterium mangrovi TaxID=1348253 RepID=A0A0B2A3J5_9MICO|nr:ABC transporter substrate-binding protein [Microbacterium mangrovi]KHK96339.1 ribose ABC transporter substrate-binding protein [Microbacterium mangrovi]
MKWNKAALGVLAVGAAATLALAGCSSSGGGDTSAGSGGSKAYKLAFVQGVAGDQFYITMQCGIQDAAKAAGATVTTQGPQKFDPTLQKPIVDSVVASHPDALLVAPTDATAMQAPIAAAKAAGIKVILVDTTLSDPSVAESQISSDNKAGGAAAFKAIQQAHPDGGKVLVVSVDPGITTTDQREQGFKAAAAADPKFQYLGVQYSHNQPATAAQIVTAALAKDPDIVGIFAANLFAAQGSATGIQQAGKKGITLVGFDAGPDQMNQLKEGQVQALIAQQPGTIGKDGVEQALNALQGKTVTPKITTGFTIITKDNMDSAEGKDAAYKSSCN